MVKNFICVVGWTIEDIKDIVPKILAHKSKRKRGNYVQTLNL